MFDHSAFDCFDHFVRNGQDRVTPKAGCDGSSAIDTSKLHGCGVAAQLQGFLDYRREVLFRPNVGQPRICDGFRRKYPVRIACFRRHEAVCCKKDRSGDRSKFLLLILPGSAEIPFEMGVLF